MFLLRNELHFVIYNFSDGKAFAPDFVLFMKDKEDKDEIENLIAAFRLKNERFYRVFWAMLGSLITIICTGITIYFSKSPNRSKNDLSEFTKRKPPK